MSQALVQQHGEPDGPAEAKSTDAKVHAAAAHGISGSAGPLPHGETIQRLFGRHDVSNVQAHTDGAAASGAQTMGARAFATGNHVAFAGAPDLHTAAHEAAHVVQQRAGVHLKGGVGQIGDAHEQNADAVADRVVAGQSAEDLLGPAPSVPDLQRASVVQRDPDPSVTHAVATADQPPEGSYTPNTASHTPAATAYTGAMDRRGGKPLGDTSYMRDYHHLAGGGSLADAPTSPQEATLLNKIRVDHRKIDPVSLRTLQEKLTIKDATGAMNTETLRKLMLDHPTFSVEALLSGTLLGADLVIVARGGNGYGPLGNGRSLRGDGPVAEGEHKADAMARVAGFADYAQLKSKFVAIELFGQPLGQGLPFLAERLKLADTYLRQRIPEASGLRDRKQLAALAQQKLQWDGKGAAAYADNVADIAKVSGGRYGAHFHASGLAIDISPTKNPYVFAAGSMSVNPTGHKVEESIDGLIADNLRYAAQIFGGEEVTPHKMMQWSNEGSTEELTAKIDMASHSLTLYLALCETGTDDEIETRFKNAGYAPDNAKALVIVARKFGKQAPGVRRYWQDNVSRGQSTGLSTHSMELVVALRDVAGLSWGGTEMSEGASGDFMHFDCRGTKVGQDLYEFAMHNRDAERAPSSGHDSHLATTASAPGPH